MGGQDHVLKKRELRFRDWEGDGRCGKRLVPRR